ncbi:MAG: carbamoyltransferase HypF [Deltaproteobacteria bacterium]|nr:carbamoyltransferase HypF [Deltaproteobacteria bacterium]
MGRVAVEPDPAPRIKGVKIQIKGIVQGVGFRPFIYHLALTNNLKGFVTNTSNGVCIEVEGPPESLQTFHQAILDEKPPLAHISAIDTIERPLKSYADFTIRKSEVQDHRSTLISPDVCVCEDCIKELFDPKDRRNGYPFINCTNCGPRYTIIMDVPYDRPLTAMKGFQMCAQCEAEYHDPANRRFHAQPNACWDCGPMVRLWDHAGREISAKDPIRQTQALLKQGKIVAIKGLGGFHLAVDATNNDAVIRLRQRKHREEKPLAIMALSLAHIRRFARVTEAEESLISSPQRPIVLLEKKPNPYIAEQVAPRNRNYGVMLPYTPLHFLMLHDEDLLALVMTSGNISEEPIAIDNEEAFERLGNIADYFLNHNRDIYLRSDDSIVRVMGGVSRQIRRSRGYVPVPIFLNRSLEPILACGAELKNTICLTRGKEAFLSQHIGDLENLETLNFFELTICHLKRILEIKPKIVAYDLHPNYLSTQYALQQESVVQIGIQHHHAHIVSGMAEHGLAGPVIGVALDGTGYGTDGHIWGGEVLVVEEHRFERAGHFAYLPMPGGVAAIKEPWRMAVSILYKAFEDQFFNMDFPFLNSIPEERIKALVHVMKNHINSPLTSSCGRLFDAVSAICGVRNCVAYEGQAAVELEAMAEADFGRVYPFEIQERDGVQQFLTAPIIRSVVDDLQTGCSTGLISATFHNTLVALFLAVCQRLRASRKLKQVVLSGYTQARVPSNDGGIALGQAVAADAIYKAQ